MKSVSPGRCSNGTSSKAWFDRRRQLRVAIAAHHLNALGVLVRPPGEASWVAFGPLCVHAELAAIKPFDGGGSSVYNRISLGLEK